MCNKQTDKQINTTKKHNLLWLGMTIEHQKGSSQNNVSDNSRSTFRFILC